MELEDKVKDLEGQLEKLANKNSELLDELKKERKSRQKLDEEVETERKRIAELEDEEKRKKAAGDGDIDALKKAYEEKIQKLSGEWVDKEKKYKTQLTDVTVKATARALAAELALPESIDVLLPHIERRLSLDTGQSTPNVVVLSTTGELSASSLEEFKNEIKGNKAFAPILRSSNASGGGAGGSHGGGAATKKFSELSEGERVELYRADPKKYEQLREKDRG